jgi:putative transposase
MHLGMKRDMALEICGITRDQFYYKPIGGKRGAKPSKTTFRMVDGQQTIVPNKDVVAHIAAKYQDPKVDYGYRKMTGDLRLDGFMINKKKVYRLMKKAMLLRAKEKRESKQWVKYRVCVPEGPFRLMEMDIKHVYLQKEARYVFVLTILDIFSRVVLKQVTGYSMTQEQVKNAWLCVITDYLEPYGIFTRDIYVEVRSDNGPQFCAKMLGNFFETNGFDRTFTHPYTPQENGHIESYHAILGQAMRGITFHTCAELEEWLKINLEFYNYRRIHGSTTNLPPQTFLDQWFKGNIEIVRNPNFVREAKFRLTVKAYTISRIEPTVVVS